LVKEIFGKTQDEITLKDNEVFVAGDDWSRSNPNVTFRILSLQEIKGKATGICTTCKKQPGTDTKS
jgi:signal peptidase I